MEAIKEKKRCLRAIEAVLFSLPAPIELSRLHALLSPDFSYSQNVIASLLDELALSYEEERRGFRLQKTPEGFRLVSAIEFAPILERLGKQKKEDKLSPQALEVLSIVAFKGPITRAKIDQLRGVDSSYCLQSLQERELIEKIEGAGEKKGPFWRVTRQFLTLLGISDPQALIEKNPLPKT